MWRSTVLAVMAGCCLGTEPLPRPDIPDPFGLGERLALIDHLKERYRITPLPDATYAQLVVLYWKARGRPDGILSETDDAALTRDRVQRLRAELKDRHGITAGPDENEEALLRRLAEVRAAHERQAAAAAAHVGRATERMGLSASEAGNVQARIERAGGEIRQAQERIAHIGRDRAALIAQAKDDLARKPALDDAVTAALAERNRWVKAGEAETRSARTVASATRDSQDKANAAYRAAVEAANALVEELNRIKADHERLEAEERRLQARIVTLDQERSGDAARVPAAAGAMAGDGAAPGAFETRLRAAVVLIHVQGRGSGSGFLVTADGLLVTNAHVVGDGSAPMTAFWDAAAHHDPARLHLVQLVAEDDLALLRAEGTGFTNLVLVEVYELTRPLAAAGFPLAGDVSRTLGTSPADIVVTRGTLSAVRRQAERIRWLQHDCRIASGSSGGPLIDLAGGTVVGVNTMVLTPGTGGGGGAGDGLNFAIPSERVRACFGSLLGGGH